MASFALRFKPSTGPLETLPSAQNQFKMSALCLRSILAKLMPKQILERYNLILRHVHFVLQQQPAAVNQNMPLAMIPLSAFSLFSIVTAQSSQVIPETLTMVRSCVSTPPPILVND